MAVQSAADPLSELRSAPGEQDIATAASREVPGARTLEVTQWLQGQLLSVHHVGAGDRWFRTRLALRVGAALLAAMGVGLFVASPVIAGPLLSAGAVLLVLAHGLARPPTVQNLGTARPLLRSSARGEFELLLPPGARSELVGPSGTRPFEGPASSDQPDDVVIAMPPDGTVRMLLGELEVRVGWTRPLRRPPPPPTSRHWRLPVAAMAVSYLVHQIFLLLVLAVPPRSVIIDDHWLDLPEPILTRRLESPCRSGRARCVSAQLDPDLIAEHDRCLSGLIDPLCRAAPEKMCSGRVPRPLVYAGHVRASGQRAARELQRPFRTRARTLESCYRAALVRCSGPGRMVFSLEIDHSGRVVASEVESSWWSISVRESWEHYDHQQLVLCIGDAMETWRLRRLPKSGITKVRLPLIFRYPGAPSRPELARVR